MWGLRLECCKKCGCTFQLRHGYYEGYGGWYEEDGLCYWCKREETVGKEQTDEEFDALVELLKKSGVGKKVKFKRSK